MMRTDGPSEAIAQGDPDRADAILAGSTFAPIDSAWCAVCITGQCVLGWIGEDHLTAFWAAQRRHWGGAA